MSRRAVAGSREADAEVECEGVSDSWKGRMTKSADRLSDDSAHLSAPVHVRGGKVGRNGRRKRQTKNQIFFLDRRDSSST